MSPVDPVPSRSGPLEGLRRSGPGTAVTDVAKHGLRAVGMATAGLRPGPDLLVIGAKRGGTTSLWRYLSEHPGILPTFPRAQQIKGTYFFDEEWSRGVRWYRSHFPTAATRRLMQRRLGHEIVSFEASPYYLFHPLAPERARQVTPEALVVAVLRDPVERAFSHWKERRNHTESLGFAEALDAEAERTKGEESRLMADPSARSIAHRHQTYVAQGCYAPMLERWFGAFGRDRVVVVPSEEMYADPQRFCDGLFDRLGIPGHRLASVEPWNAEPSPGMDAAVRERLTIELTPHVLATEEILGRSLPWARA
ncbi:MAG: sulfotransferase [Acidimicrobiales bacterium]